MARPQSITALTGLRFFAALLVVLFHTQELFLPAFAGHPALGLRNGYLGVGLFFVLSGFILAHVYVADRAPLAPRAFLLARFARIYPLYAASLVLHAPFIIAHFLDRNAPVVAAAKGALTLTGNLTMLQAWAPVLSGGWNPPGWSLSAETFFYLAFPLAAPALFRLPAARAVAVVLVVHALSLACPWLVLRLQAGAGFTDQLTCASQDWLEYCPLLHLHEFLIGILACRLSRGLRTRWPGWAASAPAALATPALLVGVVAALWSVEGLERNRILLHNGVLALLFAALVISLANARGPLERVLGSRPLVLLGESSYAIYLMHVPILYWLSYASSAAHRFASAPDPAAADSWGAFAAYLALVICSSIACFTLIEDPARRRLRSLFAPRTASPAAAEAATRPGGGDADGGGR